MLGDDTESLGAALMNQLVALGLVYFSGMEEVNEYTLRTAGFIEDLPYVQELLPAYDHVQMVYRWLHEAEAIRASARQSGDEGETERRYDGSHQPL